MPMIYDVKEVLCALLKSLLRFVDSLRLWQSRLVPIDTRNCICVA